MKSRSTWNPMRFVLAPSLLVLMTAAVLVSSRHVYAQASAHQQVNREHVVARVKGTGITEAQLLDEMEQFYPSNTAHGGLQPGKLKEIRAKALEELIVQELAYQQAVKRHVLVPMSEVLAEYRRMRTKYGPQAFDWSRQRSGLSRHQYLKNLQRRMTLERMIKRNVVRPSRVDPQALRSYYRQNREKFQRPAQVHARLILAAVDPQAGVAAELKAYEKIRKVYQEIQAGEDFALLAEQYSDDFYRVKGGDVGWMHRGRLEPDFEKVAFSLEVGKTSEPFRTAYGYNLMKVEGREPAQQMKFKEVRRALKAELEQKRMLELRRAWVEQLKKGAQVEILDEPSAPRASH